jgi:hypothetical protein
MEQITYVVTQAEVKGHHLRYSLFSSKSLSTTRPLDDLQSITEIRTEVLDTGRSRNSRRRQTMVHRAVPRLLSKALSDREKD